MIAAARTHRGTYRDRTAAWPTLKRLIATMTARGRF
jgi:hypothetical protein